jgi:DNA primase
MDSDEAGSAANLRGVQVVASAAEQPARTQGASRTESRRLEIRVLALPQGKDPDELIRADPAAWPKALEAAKPVVEHLFAVVTANRDLTEPRARSEMVSEVLPTIGEIRDPVVQAHYLQRLSRLARVSEEALRRQMRAGRNPGIRAYGRTGSQSDLPSPDMQRGSKREEFCLALLFKAPNLAGHGAALDEQLFSLSENRELLRRWRESLPILEEEGLWEHFQEVLQTHTPQIEMGKAEEAFLDCVALLQDSRMRAAKEASALALAEEEAGVRPGRVATIAWQRLAGHNEESADEAVESAAATLLEDMRAGQRYHRQRIEDSTPGEVSE